MENRDNQQAISDFDLGWLVGIIDGEGSMGIRFWSANESNGRNVGIKPVINICNCNLDIMLKVRDLLDKMQVGHTDDTTVTSSSKEMYRTTISGMLRCHRLLSYTFSKYVGKRAHAQLLVNYINKRLEKRKGAPYSESELLIAENISALNDHKAKVSLRERMRGKYIEDDLKMRSELTGDSENLAEMPKSRQNKVEVW